jgi:hypothetical protein
MRKIIKVAFCLVLIYMFASPSFVSSVFVNNELRTCEDVRRWESENFPSVIYTPYPVNITYGSNGEIINATYLVTVKMPKDVYPYTGDAVDIRLLISGVTTSYNKDLEIVPFFGKEPIRDISTDFDLVTNFNGTFALVLWHPSAIQLEKPLKITASDERVFVYEVPKEKTIEFVETLAAANLYLVHQGNIEQLNPIPDMWSTVISMGITAGTMIHGADKMYFPSEGENAFRVILLENFHDQLDPLLSDQEAFQNAVSNIINNPNNWEYFNSKEAAQDYLRGIWYMLYENKVIPDFHDEHIAWLFSWDGKLRIDSYISLPYMEKGGALFYPWEMTFKDADFWTIDAIRAEGHSSMGFYHPHWGWDDVLTRLDEKAIGILRRYFDTERVSAIVWGGNTEKYGYHNVDKAIAWEYWKDKRLRSREFGGGDAESPGYSSAEPIIASLPDDYQLALALGLNLNNFWYYNDVALLFDQILIDLSLDPSSQAFRDQMTRDIVAIRDLRQNIPLTLPSDKAGVMSQQLTDAEWILTDLSNNPFDEVQWMQASGKLSDTYSYVGYEAVPAWIMIENIVQDLGSEPQTWITPWVYTNLVRLDGKLKMIQDVLNDPFSVFIGNLLPKNERIEGIFNTIGKTFDKYPALKTFSSATTSIVFSYIGGLIANYGLRVKNDLVYGIGFVIQNTYLIKLFVVDLGRVFIQAVIVGIKEGVEAGIISLGEGLVAFGGGIIVGVIISQIISFLIMVLIYSITHPEPPTLSCPVDKSHYNNDQFTIEKNVVYPGDTLRYIYCGVKTCFPSGEPGGVVHTAVLRYTDDLNNPTIRDSVSTDGWNNNYCTSLDGRCLSCSVDVTNPSIGTWYADVIWYQYGITAPGYFRSDAEKLLVCPSDKGLDENEKACADCDIIHHTESDGTCEYGCGASLGCDELTQDSETTTCNQVGYTYFQDKCNGCRAIDKDNICRSAGSLFVSEGNPKDGCTADSECNGKEAGTSWCDGNVGKTCGSNCKYSEKCDYSCGAHFVCNGREPGKDCCTPECYFLDVGGNGDGIVNILDIFVVAKAFDSKPGDTKWNPIADLNRDGKVNILDIFLVANAFGKSCS